MTADGVENVVKQPHWWVGRRRPRFLSVTVPWTPTMTERFAASTVAGLDVTRITDLSFLPTLPGLCALRVASATRDDTPVAHCRELEWLDLTTRARRRLDLSRLVDLRDLTVDSRPGQDTFAGLSRLEYLQVDGRITHEAALRDKPALRALTCGTAPWTAVRHLAEESPRVQALTVTVDDAGIVAVAGELAHLQSLTLTLTAGPGDVDLSPLVHARQLRQLAVRAPGVKLKHVESLADLPFLTYLEVDDVRGRRVLASRAEVVAGGSPQGDAARSPGEDGEG